MTSPESQTGSVDKFRQKLSAEHQKAVHRRRRIIMNNDNEMHMPFRTPEEFLSLRTTPTADTQIDSIWYNLTVGAEMHLYDSKVGEIAGKVPYPGAEQFEGDLERLQNVWANIKSLLDVGTDPLREVVKFGQAHDKEVFASFRMNMIQGSWRPNFYTQWKRDHPDCCLGVREMAKADKNDPHNPQSLYWSGLDYAKQEVHDQRVAVIKDICSRYDVDGMELDFWRWAMYFKPTLEKKPVGPEHLESMTNLLRRIRKEMLTIEAQRKRPLLLAVRAFDTEELSLKTGLDVRTWLKEGLIDILVVGGSYTYYSIATADWAKLAHSYDVPLYICTYRSRGLEQDRAFATYHRSQGADGIYTFNMFDFPKDLPSFREIGDPELIERKDKHYSMSGTIDSVDFGHVCAGGIVPVQLRAGVSRPVVLVGDDLAKATAEGTLKEVKLRLTLGDALSAKDKIMFTLNDKLLEAPQWKEDTVEFDLTAGPLKQGQNTLGAVFGDGASRSEIKVTRIDLWVRYK